MSGDGAGLSDQAEQIYRVRVLRLAVGIGLSTAAAFGIGWPLAFMSPMLAASFLTAPAPRPKTLVLVAVPMMILIAFAMVLAVSTVALSSPILAILALVLLVFHCFYAVAQGTARMFATWALIGTLLIPMMSLKSLELALGLTLAIFWSGAAAMGFVWLAHALVPDPVGAVPAPPKKPSAGAGLRAAAKFALTRTAVIMPLLGYLLFTQGTSYLKVLIFSAILSMSPDLESGKKGGYGLLLTNLVAGVAAFVFYELLVMAPSLPFLITGFVLVALICGGQIFGGKKLGKICASGLGTFILLIGLGTMPVGDEVGAQASTRLFQFMLAVVYVFFAFRLVNEFANWRDWRHARRAAA